MTTLDDEVTSALRNAYSRAFSEIWLSWDEHWKKRPTAQHLRSLKRTQWLSFDEIEALQLASLRALLSHAKKHVPYYRELFAKLGFDAGDVKRRGDLAGLPALTRDILMERQADLLDPAYRGKTLKKGTSGSTGVPAKFEYDLDSEAWRQAVRLRGWGWGGYDMAQPVFYYWGQVAEPKWDLRGVKIRVDRALKREVFMDALKQDQASLEAAVERIKTLAPTAIVCYPQAASELARYIVSEKKRTWGDIPVICGGEALLPTDLATMKQAFGENSIYETYGSRETMLMAAECSHHSGMHLQEENIFLEVTDHGRLVPDGETGTVLVTDLHNYAMPFIRYENRDLATMKKDHRCPCERGLRLLERVDGRAVDVLRSANGNPIPSMTLNVMITGLDAAVVKQYQFVQKKGCNGATHLKLVKGKAFDEAKISPMIERFRTYLEGAPVFVEYVDSIPPQPNGKQRHVIVEK